MFCSKMMRREGKPQRVRCDPLGQAGKPHAVGMPPVLYGFSRHVCGYWSLASPASWSTPPALDAFLARRGPS